MKFYYLTLLILFLFAACKNDNDKIPQVDVSHPSTKLKNRQDTVFYSMGIVIGEQLKKYGVTQIDYDLLTKGIKDAISLNDSQLQIDKGLAKDFVSLYVNDILSGKISTLAYSNSNFLQENAKKQGVITLSNGIQYKILTEGKGKRPTSESKVEVSYTGRLTDGTIFTSTNGKKNPVFIVKNSIKGWRIILPKMNEGSEWEIYLPPDYAFGAKGTPLVPPNSVVIYRIKLLKVF